MAKQNYKIGVSTVIAGVLTLLTLYAAFAIIQTSILSAIVLIIAALIIAPILNEIARERVKEKMNLTISTPLRWIVWFVLCNVALFLR